AEGADLRHRDLAGDAQGAQRAMDHPGAAAGAALEDVARRLALTAPTQRRDEVAERARIALGQRLARRGDDARDARGRIGRAGGGPIGPALHVREVVVEGLEVLRERAGDARPAVGAEAQRDPRLERRHALLDAARALVGEAPGGDRAAVARGGGAFAEQVVAP